MTQKTQSVGFIGELKCIFKGINAISLSYTPNIIEFYAVFISEKALLSTDIQSYEKVYGKDYKPYTVYNIKIRTKTHEYKLSKRYNDFLNLHEKLKKRHPRLIKDLRFPEKNLFWGNFDSETLETRRQIFQNYLEILNENYIELNLIEFLDFLEIHSNFYCLYIYSCLYIAKIINLLYIIEIYEANKQGKLKSGVKTSIIAEENKPNNESTVDKKEKQNISDGLDQEKAFQFLWNLNYSVDNYITIFNEYEAFFLTSHPKLSLDSIKRLLLGDKSLRGLIEICGIISNPDQTYNLHHICSKAFKFLSILLDHEYNKEADIYIKVYKSASTALISTLKFNSHIKPNSQKQCKPYALRLLDLYLSQNLSKTHENLSKIINGNDEALKEYEKWKQSKRFNSHTTEQFEYRNLSLVQEGENKLLNPLLFISFDANLVKKKNIPLTKWLNIYVKDVKPMNFKLKHLNEENIKMSTYIKSKSDACIQHYIYQREAWDKLYIGCETYIQGENQIYIERFKCYKENRESNTYIYVHKRVIEKNNDEIRYIKLCIAPPYDFELKENEVLLDMNVSLYVKNAGIRKKKLRNCGNDGDLCKVKVIVKDLDAETKEVLKEELNGNTHRILDNLLNFKGLLEGGAVQQINTN